VTVQDSPGRPLRADAERNRRRILAAAGEVFAERGLGVSLDDIAQAAGVGVGTVYRRFPDKDALIDALFEEKIAAVVALARRCLEIEDPWEAFETFMRGACAMQATDRGLKEAMTQRGRGCVRVNEARETIAPLAAQLFQRGQAAGVIRADLSRFDVPLMHFAVGFVAERTRDVAPEAWQRMLTLLLDGVRPARDATTPMPVPPLDAQQWATAMSTPPGRPSSS